MRPLIYELKWAFISRYCNNFATNSRKAPAFLQGLLQFGGRWGTRTSDPLLVRRQIEIPELLALIGYEAVDHFRFGEG